MEPISLELTKAYLRIDADYLAEDTLLNLFIKSARLACEKFCNATYAELSAPVDSGEVDEFGNPILITPEMSDFDNAILMTIADLYENRGTSVVGTITASLPTTARTLLRPYKRIIFI
jgi:hypothetical protein